MSDGHERRAVRVKANLASDDQETLRAFAIEGGGIAPLYDFLAGACARERTLVRVLPQWTWFNGKLALIYPSQPFVPANVRAFIDLAVDYAGKSMTCREENRRISDPPKAELRSARGHVPSAA